MISKSLIHKTPNHALQPTAASALRLLAVPSSLRSSAAAEGERLAGKMITVITDWLSFAANAIGGACAFICLFEGTRRIYAYGVHRTAALMVGFGAAFCLMYAGFSYWKHHALGDMAQTLQRKMFLDELPADWGKDLPPDKREASSLTIARMAFVESGTLRPYFDGTGERKPFTPNQEDVKRRDFAVVTQARLEDAIHTNFVDALLWLIWGLVAAVFGYGVSREKLPLPANRTIDAAGHRERSASR